jgi:flagellar biosynthetic protein FlhB
MAEESFQERTEKATPRRREKAREEGRVARSQELNSAVLLCLGITAVYLLGPALSIQLKQFMNHLFTEAPGMNITPDTAVNFMSSTIATFFILLGPIFIVLMVIAYGINVLQVGILFTPKPLEPKLDKLNIVNGIKRLVSVRSMVELIRDVVKVILIGTVGYISIKSQLSTFFSLSDQSVGLFAGVISKRALLVALEIGAVMLILALLDYAYQKYDFEKNIRMSKQEVKEEMKDYEGSPQTKARIRRIQREMSQRRMMREIPKADVVITNPTHLAVALKYNQDEMEAPMVVAKGERLLAERIKEIATESNVPILENKPLARALFNMCEVGSYVPAQLYRAVAEVLAYIYRLKNERVNS